MIKLQHALAVTACLVALLTAPALAQSGPVKVFILAGQSNMEGKAPNALCDHQATAPETAKLFAHLRKNGKWIVRDDVFIKYLRRKGGLTIGYGSRNRTGVELEFGTVLGDHFKQPVLQIDSRYVERKADQRPVCFLIELNAGVELGSPGERCCNGCRDHDPMRAVRDEGHDMNREPWPPPWLERDAGRRPR